MDKDISPIQQWVRSQERRMPPHLRENPHQEAIKRTRVEDRAKRDWERARDQRLVDNSDLSTLAIIGACLWSIFD